MQLKSCKSRIWDHLLLQVATLGCVLFHTCGSIWSDHGSEKEAFHPLNLHKDEPDPVRPYNLQVKAQVTRLLNASSQSIEAITSQMMSE